MSFSEWMADRTGGQTMLSLTCSKIPSVDLAHNWLLCAKDLGIWEMCYNIILLLRL